METILYYWGSIGTASKIRTFLSCKPMSRWRVPDETPRFETSLRVFLWDLGASEDYDGIMVLATQESTDPTLMFSAVEVLDEQSFRP